MFRGTLLKEEFVSRTDERESAGNNKHIDNKLWKERGREKGHSHGKKEGEKKDTVMERERGHIERTKDR